MQTHIARFAKETDKKIAIHAYKTRMAIKIIIVRRTTTTARGNDSRGSWCLYRD